MRIGIQTNLRPAKFKQAVANKLSRDLTIYFNRINKRIQRIVQIETRRALEESPEVQAMIYGVLRGELGLTEPKGKLKQIIDTFVNSMSVSVRKPRVAGGKISASLEVGIGAPDYSDILGLPAAKQDWTDARRRRIKGPPLEWLRWMLLEGASRIIIGYDVVENVQTGRSGLRYVMRRRPTSWSVPSQFQGYSNNNFITRAINTRADIIEQRIINLLKHSIR